MSWSLVTFNVNGIRARLATVVEWLGTHRPDVLCLQEIKCQTRDFPSDPFLEAGYVVNVRGQKSFNGVAILTKSPPSELLLEPGDGERDDEARFIAALVDGVWVVNTYVPQGRDPADPAFTYKLEFLARLKRWFADRFDPGDPLVWTGDINIAPDELDVFDPKRMDGKVGFHPAERAALADVASWGFVDLFRSLHPGMKQFTFWDYRLPQSYQRNLGWRLDHIMVTEPMAGIAVGCSVDGEMRSRPTPSDHAPVMAELDLGKLAAARGA